MTTNETLLNLKAVKEWLISQGVKNTDVGNHMITNSSSKTLDYLILSPSKCSILEIGLWTLLSLVLRRSADCITNRVSKFHEITQWCILHR